MTHRIASFEWKIIGNVIITMSANGEIAEKPWNDFIQDLRTKAVTRWLSANIGTVEVSSLQRKAAIDIMNERGILASVITDDRIVRGIVTAASWFGAKATPFSWDNLKDGVVKLDIREPTLTQVVDLARSFQRRVSTG